MKPGLGSSRGRWLGLACAAAAVVVMALATMHMGRPPRSVVTYPWGEPTLIDEYTLEVTVETWRMGGCADFTGLIGNIIDGRMELVAEGLGSRPDEDCFYGLACPIDVEDNTAMVGTQVRFQSDESMVGVELVGGTAVIGACQPEPLGAVTLELP